MSKPNTDIILPLGATADANTCGSCHFFKRLESSGWGHRGLCGLKLPDHYLSKPYDPESIEPNNTMDTNRCDLWRPDGKTYIVSQRVKP